MNDNNEGNDDIEDIDVNELLKNMTPEEARSLNNEILGIDQSPEAIEERLRIAQFADILRDVPAPMWPYLPVRWDTKPESWKYYSDNPDCVKQDNLHLENDVDLSVLNSLLTPHFKLDCLSPWEHGNPHNTSRALGRWLAGYPVSPSYVEIRGNDRLVLEGNHRLRTAYFGGYRKAPILMQKSQMNLILSLIEESTY